MLWHGLVHRHVLKNFLLSNMWPGSCKLLLTASLPPKHVYSVTVRHDLRPIPIYVLQCLLLTSTVKSPLLCMALMILGDLDPDNFLSCPSPFPFHTLLHWLIYLSVCSHCALSPECLFILLCPALIRQDPYWDPQSTLLVLSFSNDYTED